ncbi:glycosyltransferase family 25 protein [Avibacterium paragallinarum]|uniref:glycosyltransferase family 25 protein n=1 Tax=Avibacterium paragallinarum TaxID=728 RepID=UPI0021F700FD|nr:glycosyltransferase family 25 protein [Avibacterium paragallinarum]UXN35753.1 glycosyltransferase family 25 protein [Avibacterium paragallinarum]
MFVISLKHSSRREFISARLLTLGLSFEFFDAVYGKELEENDLAKVDFSFYSKEYNSLKPLTLGEIGCAMSHIKLYEHIVKNNISEAIILEDDAIVSLYFEDILRAALKKLSSSKEILFLDHGKAKVWPLMRSLPERYRLARYRSPSRKSKRCIIKTTAYLITLNGAKKLLKQAYPIRMPADFLTGLLQLTGIKAYGIEPPCVFGSNDSEIDKIENRYE